MTDSETSQRTTGSLTQTITDTGSFDDDSGPSGSISTTVTTAEDEESASSTRTRDSGLGSSSTQTNDIAEHREITTGTSASYDDSGTGDSQSIETTFAESRMYDTVWTSNLDWSGLQSSYYARGGGEVSLNGIVHQSSEGETYYSGDFDSSSHREGDSSASGSSLEGETSSSTSTARESSNLRGTFSTESGELVVTDSATGTGENTFNSSLSFEDSSGSTYGYSSDSTVKYRNQFEVSRSSDGSSADTRSGTSDRTSDYSNSYNGEEHDRVDSKNNDEFSRNRTVDASGTVGGDYSSEAKTTSEYFHYNPYFGTVTDTVEISGTFTDSGVDGTRSETHSNPYGGSSDPDAQGDSGPRGFYGTTLSSSASRPVARSFVLSPTLAGGGVPANFSPPTISAVGGLSLGSTSVQAASSAAITSAAGGITNLSNLGGEVAAPQASLNAVVAGGQYSDTNFGFGETAIPVVNIDPSVLAASSSSQIIIPETPPVEIEYGDTIDAGSGLVIEVRQDIQLSDDEAEAIRDAEINVAFEHTYSGQRYLFIRLPATHDDQTGSNYLVLQRHPIFETQYAGDIYFPISSQVEIDAFWKPAAYLNQFFTGSDADAQARALHDNNTSRNYYLKKDAILAGAERIVIDVTPLYGTYTAFSEGRIRDGFINASSDGLLVFGVFARAAATSVRLSANAVKAQKVSATALAGVASFDAGQKIAEGDFVGGALALASVLEAVISVKIVPVKNLTVSSSRSAAKSADKGRSLSVLQRTCFVAGTPVLQIDGSIAIEEIRVGDMVFAKPEDDPSGKPEIRTVEKTFKLESPTMSLKVGGQRIETTAEHPFYVDRTGWVAASELAAGDLLVGLNGETTRVDAVNPTGHRKTVYNICVAEDHTYFIGSIEWGFSVWVHNSYSVRAAADGTFEAIDASGSVVRAGLDEETARGLARLFNELPEVKKAVNSNIQHAADRASLRLQVPRSEAVEDLKQITKTLKANGIPSGAIPDPGNVIPRSDSILIPYRGGAAVYEIGKNGTAKLATVLSQQQFVEALIKLGIQ